MIETRVEGLAAEIEGLKKKDETLYTQIRELQEILNGLVEKNALPVKTDSELDNGKVKYLTEVNEQMFQQNKRLRRLIEYSIETKTLPTHKEYLGALQG